ncbi:RNA-binding protein 28-like isoform X2 [Clavelina lepadiformis]|uniref:RNA-binding protein 28-like isoform X2 n=1 Tax=Clavelina lepadiformis TaxID=159417 RepID=UPI004042260A
MAKTMSHKTVFVQNIPPTCTNDQLQEVFSVVGPIKECFVVKPKDKMAEERKKFFGFVTYHSPDDAKTAVNSPANTFIINGVKTKVIFAKRKKSAKEQTKKVSTKEQSQDLDFEIVSSDQPDKVTKGKKAVRDAKLEELPSGVTVVLTGFPKSFTITHFVKLWKLKKLDLPEQFILPQKEDNDCVAHAVMANKQLALKTVSRLNGFSFEGKIIKATLVLDHDSKDFRKLSKRSRLIIRNLSFLCTTQDLQATFSRFGNITDVKIPTKPNGKMYGYGFVQFSHVFEATKAMKEINMTEIKGRKVAVDWALPREKYKEMQQRSDMDASMADTTDGGTSSQSDDEDEENIESDIDDDIAHRGSSTEEDNDSESDSLENETEVASSCENEDDEDTDSEGSNHEEGESTKMKTTKKKLKDYSSDVHEGKTVFIRNLSFDAEEKDLCEIVEKFGEFKYCKIVQNSETGLSKGCAFVQFLSKDVADECVRAVNSDEPIMIQGRQLYANIAQSRSDVRKIVKERKQVEKEKDDGRNLHLANEGLIRPGTQAATGLSEIELNKRQKIENAKRQKLKNPNVFVSTTRLCIHNLPRTTDDAALKNLFLKHAGGGKDVKITEVRVMRNREKVNTTGLGRSLGFAFVNFTKHEHALRALRELNNNPDTFSASKRPIVEFSLENKQALELQAQRRKRQLAKNELQKKMSAKTEQNSEESVKLDKKTRRMQKRQADRAEKRQANKTIGKESSPPTKKDKNDSKSTVMQERKSFQGGVGVTASGKKLKMPKHTGPKIRNRNKGQILEQLKTSKKLNKARGRKDRTEKSMRQPKSSKPEPSQYKSLSKAEEVKRSNRKRKQDSDLKQDREFHSLVEKYTKQFKTTSASQIKRPKWFDG